MEDFEEAQKSEELPSALGHAAKAIGEDDEYDRIRQMLSDADPDSVATLLD